MGILIYDIIDYELVHCAHIDRLLLELRSYLHKIFYLLSLVKIMLRAHKRCNMTGAKESENALSAKGFGKGFLKLCGFGKELCINIRGFLVHS